MSDERRDGVPDLSSMSGEDLESAVQNILGDPSFQKLARQFSAGGSPAKEESSPEAPPTPAGMQITPDMMARLPEIMSAIAPLVSGVKGGKSEGGGGGGKNDDGEKRKRLLAALRPYMSSSRRDAIDSIMKVSEMTDLIGKFGGAGGIFPKDPTK